MTTTEQLLADPAWRRRHSVYTLWALFFGFGFVSLAYTGARAKKSEWIIWSVVYGVLVLGALTIGGSLSPNDRNEPTPLGANLAYAVWMIVWVISAIHVFRARKDWLRWKATAASQPRWYESDTTAETANVPAAADLGEIGLDDPTSEYLAAAPPAPTPRTSDRLSPPPPIGPPEPQTTAPDVATRVDLNTASLDELAALPGVGMATARRILDERQRRGGFESVDEAAVAANVQPHVRSRLQKLAVVAQRRQSEGRANVGRIVDI